MPPNPPLLLAANWEEIISFLVGAVVLVFWLIGQINQARKKPGPMMGPPAQPAPPAPPADPLRAQIDEFLRRAQQAQQAGGPVPAARREAVPAPPRPPVHEEIVVLLDEAPAEAQRGPQAPVLRPVPEAQPEKPAPPGRRPRRVKGAGAPLGKGVAEHVAANVAGTAQKFREEVAHLGERVKHADEQFDVQLQQKFDHELGSLGEGRAATAYEQKTASAADTPAARIAAMLTTPEGAQQAIVLNEILRRPEEGW